jgi:hypothetical protein
MMQKVQAWSQPFCTATNARVWRSDAATGTGGAGTCQRAGSSLAAFSITPSTSSIAAKVAGSIVAAQPVTSRRACGWSRRRRRTARRDWRTASAVTAQELTTTVAVGAAASRPRMASLSERFIRQPSVTTSGGAA